MALGNILVLALVFVTVGFIGGALVAMLFADRGKENVEKDQPDKETIAEEQQELEATAAEEPITKLDNEIEVLRLLRSRSSGKLIAILDEKRFESVRAMDERLRQQIALLTREWLIWIGAPAEERQKPARHKPAAADTAPPQSSSSAIIEESQTPPPSVPIASNEAQKPLVSKVLEEKKVPPTLLSIVEQIDEVLQEMLPNSPLAGKIIKLAEDPKEGGVTVWIGARRYHGIDSVDDEEAKALLRAAVAEWEHRNERR